MTDMTDMNALERLVTDVADDLMGPSRSFDTAAIVQSAKTMAPGSRWTELVQRTVGDRSTPAVGGSSMFSAVKFIAAAVIVVLFGGFLVAGILTAPQGDEVAPAVPGAATGGPGTFGPAGSLTEPRRLHTATLLPDGRVAVIGGDAGVGASLDSIEVWDPASASFAMAGSLAEARTAHTATRLPDGRVLVVGGFIWERKQAGTNHASTELWDPATESSTRVGALAEARYGHTATLLPDGRVLVVGGETAQGGRSVRLASAEIWDPTTESFGPAGSLETARISHTATLLPDGRVLVVGGDPWPTGDEWVATAELWDPETASFGPAGSLSARLDAHTATLLPDGRVLVVGLSDLAFAPRASAAIWDPAVESFATAGSLSGSRVHHTATLLPDGRVLVAGGADNRGTFFASVEAWDLVTESFTAAGPLAEARQRHTATLLPDGRVLVVGGDTDSKPIASAEVWAPIDG